MRRALQQRVSIRHFHTRYREKYERRGGTAAQFIEAYHHADPEKVADYLLEHRAEDVRGALISAAMAYRDTCRTHTDALVALLQEGRAAMIYERLVADLPELPERDPELRRGLGGRSPRPDQLGEVNRPLFITPR